MNNETNKCLQSLENEMSDMNITPMSSPERAGRDNSNPMSLKSRNTPSRTVLGTHSKASTNNHPNSMMNGNTSKFTMTSPVRRCNQSYTIYRTQSSPSVIDSSPKTALPHVTDIGTRNLSPPSFFRTTKNSELTPVTNNIHNHKLLVTISRNAAESMRIPPSMNIRHASDRTSSQNRAVPINPRTDAPLLQARHQQRGLDPDPVSPPISTRTVSPLSRSHHILQHEHHPTSPPPAPLLTNSPLAQSIPLERNCYSLTSPPTSPRLHQGELQTLSSESGDENRPPSTTTTTTHDTTDHTPQPPQLEYMIPYQPSRDSSLASFGIHTEDVGGIFLAPRRHNRRDHRRHRSTNLRRLGAGETTREDDGDESMEESLWGDFGGRRVGDDEASLASSIPSIRMAVRLNDSETVMDDDGSWGMEDGLVGERENDAEGCLSMTQPHGWGAYHHQQQLGVVNDVPLDMAVTPSPPRRSSRVFFEEGTKGESTGQDESRRLCNGALEWLKTVEVGRDNEYVAEAASSKFLTGKRSHTTAVTVDTNRNRNVNFAITDSVGIEVPENNSVGIGSPRKVNDMKSLSTSNTIGEDGTLMVENRCAQSTNTINPDKITITEAPQHQPTSNVSATVGEKVLDKPPATKKSAGQHNNRRKEVMGRSINMLNRHSGSRGTKRNSRPRASAVMR